jgi:hypothetical protein
MTKKDYIRAAEIVRVFRNYHGPGDMSEGIAVHIEDALVDLFAPDNRRFDVDRFREACKIKP